MSYLVEVQPAAQRDFDALSVKVRQQVARCLKALAEDPRPPGFKPLTERQLKGSCRVHVGPDHCVAYDVDDKAGWVSVWLIGRRATFYDVAKRRRR